VTELPWRVFMDRHARAHLLMGEFDHDEELTRGKRNRNALLSGLAQAKCRRGNYAVTILHDVEGDDIAMIGIEHVDDAMRISRALRARSAPRFDPWLSHRSFKIDTQARRRMALKRNKLR